MPGGGLAQDKLRSVAGGLVQSFVQLRAGLRSIVGGALAVAEGKIADVVNQQEVCQRVAWLLRRPSGSWAGRAGEVSE